MYGEREPETSVLLTCSWESTLSASSARSCRSSASARSVRCGGLCGSPWISFSASLSMRHLGAGFRGSSDKAATAYRLRRFESRNGRPTRAYLPGVHEFFLCRGSPAPAAAGHPMRGATGALWLRHCYRRPRRFQSSLFCSASWASVINFRASPWRSRARAANCLQGQFVRRVGCCNVPDTWPLKTARAGIPASDCCSTSFHRPSPPRVEVL